jgi:Holliday junction DNA helicase RuvA
VIAHLRGKILSKSPNSVILDCNGVGYELAISVATYTDLGAEGTEAKLHVHTHVREDALSLFGFSELPQKFFVLRRAR